MPFLPLAALTWWSYHSELGDIEAEIQGSNRHIAGLAAGYLGLLVERAHDEARLLADAARLAPSGEQTQVRWELVDGVGRVLDSQLGPDRIGSSSGYEELVPGLEPGRTTLSEVRSWIAGRAPTALVLARRAHGGAVVGVFVPEALHADLQAWASSEVDRRVYSVDRDGRLLFYSDLELSGRGEDLSGNPPIELLLAGGDGELRYCSVVTGKERLAFVERMAEAGWGVVVSADVGQRVIRLETRTRALGLSILFALTAAVAIVLVVSRRLAEPLVEISRALRAPDRAPHAPLGVSDRARRLAEVDDLVHAFDELAAEVEATERELVHAERSALLGQLASGLAHEMGTPLNVITGNAQYLLRKAGPDDPARPPLELIERQAHRIAGMIRRLLDLSRPAPARLLPLDVGAIARQTLDTVRGVARGIELSVRVAPATPPAMADPKLLEHALLNLVVNACDAMPEGGCLEVRVEPVAQRRGAGGPWVRVAVVDNGRGMGPDELLRATEPFFTTKAQGRGTGLGLAIVERIVRQHGGLLELNSGEGRGTTASLWLRPAHVTGQEAP